MSGPPNSGDKLVTSHASGKKYTFNVNANFKPQQKYAEQTASAPSKDKLAKPAATFANLYLAEPLPSNHVPSNLPHGRQNCGCAARQVEVCARDISTVVQIVNLALALGGLQNEPVIREGAKSAVLKAFDDRWPELFRDHVLSQFLRKGHNIHASVIRPEKQEVVALGFPWPIALPKESLAHWMAQIGDVAQIKFETLKSGEITKALCMYHDSRALAKALGRPLLLGGYAVTPSIETTFQLFWCANKERHQPSTTLLAEDADLVTRTLQTLDLNPQQLAKERVSPHPLAHMPLLNQGAPYQLGTKAPSPRFQPNQSGKPLFLPVLREDKSISHQGNSRFSFDRLSQEPSPYGDMHGAPSMAAKGMGPRSPYFVDTATGSINSLISVSSNSSSVSSYDGLGSVSSLESTNTSAANTVAHQKNLMKLLQKFTKSDALDGNAKVNSAKPRHEEGTKKLLKNLTAKEQPSTNKGHVTAINLAGIANGSEKRTTVMVRNIPNKLEFNDFKRFVDQTNERTYEFLYLRFDFSNRCNVGYAFISFNSPKDVKTFVEKRTGMKWSEYNHNSEKVIDIRFARIQGRESLIHKFRNSPVMSQEPAFRPRFYYTSGDLAGQEEPFPKV